MTRTIGDSDLMRQGRNQNFLVVQDVDWSLQKIGRTENKDNSIIHRVTVANAVDGKFNTAASAEELKVFVPLSTGDADNGFCGLIQSEQYTDTDQRIPLGTLNRVNGHELTIYMPYTISNLKLAKDVKDNDNGEGQVGLEEGLGITDGAVEVGDSSVELSNQNDDVESQAIV